MKITSLSFLNILLFASLQGCQQSGQTPIDQPTRTTVDSMVQEDNILFLTRAQRDARFRKIEDFSPVRVVNRGGNIQGLPDGDPLDLHLQWKGKRVSIEEYLEIQHGVGMVVLQDGKIRLEQYGKDANEATRWISFSVTKSITSTLLGAAIKDGLIDSIDDSISKYVPELVGSGYEGIPIRHVLTMSSGIKWNEDYSDVNSDVSQMAFVDFEEGENPTIAHMRKMKREVEPGTRWNYSTGEADLIGVLVAKATGKTLSAYLSEKIWVPLGMESEATWKMNRGVVEFGGCCVSATVRDFARFGQFILNELNTEHSTVLPKGYLRQATTKQADTGMPDRRAYGYQWWINDDGSFRASGIYGQGIFIDPTRNLVIATNANYPSAVDPEAFELRGVLYETVRDAIDKH